MNDSIVCKYCGSSEVVTYGTFEGVQRYWCKDSKRKFADNNALPHMKTSSRIVASALSCYFGGIPLDSIQRHLQQQELAMSSRFVGIDVCPWSKAGYQNA